MEVQNKTYCVYIHTNKENGKVYIGQTKFGDDPNKRWRDGEGYGGCILFENAIKKYGWDSFNHDIIASGLTMDEANRIEESMIQQFDSTNSENGYNIRLGGENYEWAEISKLKMAKSLRDTIREKHKTTSEESLKDRFYENDQTVRKCSRCGTLFETKLKYKKSGDKRSMRRDYSKRHPRICPDCRNDDNNKPKNVVKTCIDCGVEFICSVFATMKVRCDECQKTKNIKKYCLQDDK